MENDKEVQQGMYYDFYGWLYCCSSPRNVTLPPVTSGKNLARPAPEGGESRADLRLPFYTAGFT